MAALPSNVTSLLPSSLSLEGVSSKRRLSSSPSEFLSNRFDEHQIPSQSSSLEATTETLLLSALAHRAKNRELQELVLHSARRLLPLEQILPP